MKDQKKDLGISRRNFNKALVATAVTAPIGASLVSCSKPPASNPCSCPDHQGQPIKCASILEDLELEPHEPPIGVSNGSVKLDLEVPFTPSSGTGSRPYNYSVPDYTEIYRVQVITEREKYFSNYFYYLNFRQSYLGLWLQKKTPAGSADPWYPQDTSGEPHILFKFVANPQGINHFLLETDAELRRSNCYKVSRPNRYDHPGFGGNDFFRLAKWSLFYPTPANVITGIDGSRFEEDLTSANSDINGFHLAVAFEHVDHFRKRKNL